MAMHDSRARSRRRQLAYGVNEVRAARRSASTTLLNSLCCGQESAAAMLLLKRLEYAGQAAAPNQPWWRIRGAPAPCLSANTKTATRGSAQ